MTLATAPGKVILLGEHAVVYGRPAIAAPVWQVMATAVITDRARGQGCQIVARDLALTLSLREASADQPQALVVRLALADLGIDVEPDWQIGLSSTIPIASGLGSGAALNTALVRAIYAHAGRSVDPASVSALVYASEQIYHGTPSGIDNTVIAHGAPIWFIKGRPPTPFAPARPFLLAIGDSGLGSPTLETVADVRRGWQADPSGYEARFDAIGEIVQAARAAIETGDLAGLGAQMDKNQMLLAELGVSSTRLEGLIAAARSAGALGAKLSGGGRGGNMIALVEEHSADHVRAALLAAGAAQVIVTEVGAR